MEAVVVCVDNSEWTRNGDYAPSRIRAQTDAVNLLAGAKLQTNPENTVGVLTMAGKSPKVLVTPTPSLGKILNAMHDVDVDGQANFDSSVQIAQLALKHRQNKNQRQRIVLFMGSPLSETKVCTSGFSREAHLGFVSKIPACLTELCMNLVSKQNRRTVLQVLSHAASKTYA